MKKKSIGTGIAIDTVFMRLAVPKLAAYIFFPGACIGLSRTFMAAGSVSLELGVSGLQCLAYSSAIVVHGENMQIRMTFV
jgi:hypothetical protein